MRDEWDRPERQPPKEVRCATYARKSTDEGLDSDFSSIDNQCESCDAAILSHKHEGWVQVNVYHDGGFTGGNMDRPGLQRLLADIEAGKIDCVVVYKVDRLTRSLLDFARMMELFERRRVSFVSVTQEFNTTTSLGRLVLNILLSFAQFEREMIVERTRDKMSAARRKGKWTGGMPVLGYDVDSRGGKLVVNEEEGTRVRAMFKLYLELRSLIAVVQQLNRRGWTTKQWVTKRGHNHKGQPFTKAMLFRLLTNVIYTGQVNHKGKIYAGEHAPIIERPIWEQVNRALRHNGTTGGKELRNKYGAILRGLLHCEPCGTAMVHTYSIKGDRRYRYYVCLTAQQRGWASCPSKSLPAQQIEDAVVDRIRGLGKNPQILAETLRRARDDSDARRRELQSEQESCEKEIRRLNRELLKVAGSVGNGTRTDRLADLQHQLRVAELRASEVRTEVLALVEQAISRDEVAEALAAFEPVWKSLNTFEQSRLLKMIIERVSYDGRSGRVAVSFRSTALKEVCGATER